METGLRFVEVRKIISRWLPWRGDRRASFRIFPLEAYSVFTKLQSVAYRLEITLRVNVVDR